jgi:hypothetical protein
MGKNKRNTRNKASAQKQAGITAETVGDGANCGQVPHQQVAATEDAAPARASSASEGIQLDGSSKTAASRDQQDLGQSGEGAVGGLLEGDSSQVDREEESWIKTDDDRRIYGTLANCAYYLYLTLSDR